MISKSLVLAVTAALCGIAAAQPVDQDTADVPPTPTPTPTPPPPPPPRAEPPPPPPPVEREASIHDLDGDRPTDLAFAIGVGYTRPAGGSFDLQTPNIASARLRLLSGLTFEPTVTISNSSIDTNPGTGAADSTESITEFGVGTLVRYPVIRHAKVDFEVLGSIGFDVTKDDPQGDYNTKTTSDLTLGWGVGIGYWLTHHWQLSASATDPLVTYTKTSQEVSQTATMSTSTTSIGITFDPTITFMIHLYN